VKYPARVLQRNPASLVFVGISDGSVAWTDANPGTILRNEVKRGLILQKHVLHPWNAFKELNERNPLLFDEETGNKRVVHDVFATDTGAMSG